MVALKTENVSVVRVLKKGCIKINFLYQYVILNEVKNLNTSTYAFQILRNAQDDTTK